ncbi:MAG: HypC/HybG/HupF family hydrogenase formation chaperone [candidate division WS1 bacterium]|jgi:hydrogenase expression/formation protein HypC|nr:HypC/HybG/HupF family hydrogenase formation chaperone [candidate division WS1 bacterium]
MCVAIPGCITQIEGKQAQVRVGQSTVSIRLELLGDQVSVGDYVLVHAGFAINKIDRQEAEELEELWRELGGASW